MRRKLTIYLAGPFFNSVQSAHAKAIAALTRECGHTPLAPIEQGFEKVSSPEDAARIFAKNASDLRRCDLVLAQLDYPLEPGTKLLLGRFQKPSIEIMVPDSGTVWEIGYANGIGKSVIGYVSAPVPKLNVMLAQSCDGFLLGMTEVKAFLRVQDCEPTEQQRSWRGGLV